MKSQLSESNAKKLKLSVELANYNASMMHLTGH
jgi:hypothetical protein